MDIVSLQNRIMELSMHISQTKQNLQQVSANFNALEGAKQECEKWLENLVAEDEAAKKIEPPLE